MRIKIISIFAVIVAICGLLSFFIVRQSLQSATTNKAELADRAKEAANSAAARLELDALENERWLGVKAQEAATREAISGATHQARGDASTALCDAILNSAKSMRDLGGVPSLVIVVDSAGKVIGRNGSTLSRGEDVTNVYPSLKGAIAKGSSGSDIGAGKDRTEPYIVSYSPIHDDGGKVAGALLMGVTITDELARVASSIGGAGLALVTGGDNGKVMASAGAKNDAAKAALDSGALGPAKSALAAGHAAFGEANGLSLAATPLDNFGDGKRVAVVVASPTTLLDGVGSIQWTVLAVTLLGLVMVLGAGWMLGSYISEPINTLEEGLLAIINGQEDKRFNLEHPEFGGLAFRIDQLLNKLAGIEEDTTDAEGRVATGSIVPAATFRDVMGERQASIVDTEADVAKLAAELAEAYYSRIFAEYIAAKKALGEATDHITSDTFRGRIEGMENDAAQKHGRRVRYRVQTDGQQVTLLAIPLA